jgi:hypothetical protein
MNPNPETSGMTRLTTLAFMVAFGLVGAVWVCAQPSVIPTVGPRSIMVNSNGVLVGASTKLFEANSNALNRVVLHPGEGGGSLPDGGTQGQVLAKQSATDGDVGWTNPAAGGSSVLVEETVIVNPNFKAGTNVLLEVQDVTNVVFNVTSDVVNITTGDIGYLARTAAVVTVDESDGEVNAYTFTIAAGTLAVDGDELELYAMGRFRPYSGTANGYYYSLYSTELVTDILTDNIFEDEYSTVSSYPCEWRIRLKRVDANTLAASMLHTVSPPATLTPGSEATIVRTTGNPVIDLGLLSFADDDLEFVLQAEISDAMVSADLTFYGYTITKIGTGGSGGGDVSSVFGRTGAILAVSTDYDDYFQATNAALTALAANPQLYQATNAALTALGANPQLYQATNAALTALAANPQLYQATNAALTALGANPQLYQATNVNLTALAANPQIYQSTNAALTALSANPQLYQATNVALTALASNPQLYQVTNINLTALAADPQIYQATNATLTSLGALGNGIVAKTGAGALSARTVTGDSEIVVSNGDGVSGNPTLSIAASITRDSELASYAPLSSPTLTTPTFNTYITGGTDAFIVLDEHASAPGTPAAGSVAVYAKADGKVYRKDDAGTEAELGGASGGSWDGSPIASGTITNLTAARINGSIISSTINGSIWSDGVDNGENTTTFFRPFQLDGLASGTIGSPSTYSSLTAHGVQRWSSSASANSGNSLYLNHQRIARGGESYVAILSFTQTNNIAARIGLHDHASTGGGNEAVRIDLEGGLMYGLCRDSGTQSTTASTFTPELNVFYWVESSINSDATLVTFSIYKVSDGSLLWSDTVNSNIPTNVARTTQFRLTIYHTGTTAQEIALIDAVGILATKPRI